MNDAEATELLERLTSAWPSAKPEVGTIRVWVDVFAEYAFEDAALAVDELIRNEQWFPTIAKLRERIASVRREVQHRWACHPDCPRCGGTALQGDAKGQDWLCPDAAWTTVRPAAAPGGEAPDHKRFLAAARALLPAMKGPQ